MSTSFYKGYMALHESRRSKIDKVLGDIGSQYVFGIHTARAVLASEKTSYAGELWNSILHIHWIWQYTNYYNVGFYDPPQAQLWHEFDPNGWIIREVYGSLHYLNESLGDRNPAGFSKVLAFQLQQEQLWPDNRFRSMGSMLRGEFRGFFWLLPEQLNLFSLDDLRKRSEHLTGPRLKPNTSGVITQEYIETLGGYKKYLQIIQALAPAE